MTCSELSQALNVQISEQVWERYFPLLNTCSSELCTEAMIDRLQDRFQLFGRYYTDVKEGFADLKNDPARKLFLDIFSLYMRECTVAEARAIPYPAPAGTPASHMLPLLVHLPSVEQAYDKLIARGFTHGEAVNTLSAYKIYLWEVENHRDGFIGISPAISCWMSQFTKGDMFYPGHGGINFQIITLPKDEPYFLRNRKTGKIQPVFGNSVRFHRSGLVLGSAGAEAPEGAFTAEFTETEKEYIGNPVENNLASAEAVHFSKDEWELALQPGDSVITTHIFWGSDFSPETVSLAFSEGQRMAREYFPEYSFKALRCFSWLMNPVINEALGKEAKLSQFSARFIRYPRISAAKAFLPYVFPGVSGDYAQYPENSRLQKVFKQILLDGGHIHEYPGVVLF